MILAIETRRRLTTSDRLWHEICFDNSKTIRRFDVDLAWLMLIASFMPTLDISLLGIKIACKQNE